MNKVFLLGNVGTDPVIRYADRSPVASFTLATNERAYTTANGATVPERTEWHNIVMWNKNAEIAEKYIRKGTRLLIEGKMRTRTWEDRSAIKRTITEIYVENFEFLGGPQSSYPAQGQSTQQPFNQNPQQIYQQSGQGQYQSPKPGQMGQQQMGQGQMGQYPPQGQQSAPTDGNLPF